MHAHALSHFRTFLHFLTAIATITTRKKATLLPLSPLFLTLTLQYILYKCYTPWERAPLALDPFIFHTFPLILLRTARAPPPSYLTAQTGQERKTLLTATNPTGADADIKKTDSPPFYMFSNWSTRRLVLPLRISRRVLYLSRPWRTFSRWILSLAVSMVSSRERARSCLRALS